MAGAGVGPTLNVASSMGMMSSGLVADGSNGAEKTSAQKAANGSTASMAIGSRFVAGPQNESSVSVPNMFSCEVTCFAANAVCCVLKRRAHPGAHKAAIRRAQRRHPTRGVHSATLPHTDRTEVQRLWRWRIGRLGTTFFS